MEHSSAIKKDVIMPMAATWMDPETVILTEVSQREKKREYDRRDSHTIV